MIALQQKRPLLLPASGETVRKVRVFSFGGGVQSTSVLVLQATGKLPLPYDVFVFSNVGDDSENPDTIRYIEEIAKPYASKHGIDFVTVQKTTRGEPETLLEYIHRTERSVPIPARMGGNGAPGNRSCTQDFKIKVIDKWVKEHKYTHAVIGLGISLDEYHRARDQRWHDRMGKHKLGFWKMREHQLIDLRIRRDACKKIIHEAGLPVPPKSSCWFCPFARRGEWIEMKRTNPDLFQQAIELEQHINSKRELLGRDQLFLHPDLVPLDQAVGDQMPMFPDWEMDQCESGYCFV